MHKLIGIALFLVIIFPQQQAYATNGEVYIALGDSLAAGQTPYSQIDAGYTDFIAMQLAKHNNLSYFSKALTFPGYSVENVLESIQSEQAQTLLSKSTLITISAGANNVLPIIVHNPNNGTLAYSPLSANFALNEVRIKMQELLTQVKGLAPHATIYVMGYYFPYSSVHEEQMGAVGQELRRLNTILKQQAQLAGAQFVNVYDVFGERSQRYLPNSADVHPNQLGYMTMANAMLAQFSSNSSYQISEQALPTPNPKSFQQLLSEQQ